MNEQIEKWLLVVDRCAAELKDQVLADASVALRPALVADPASAEVDALFNVIDERAVARYYRALEQARSELRLEINAVRVAAGGARLP